ncbi:deoxyhypusine synthase family protein [Desulfovibrio ferrophilus]|uniref:Deoxyhypusine synthase-like protein n=1 Tax=Desulfovibrio ferrophilus TaxID=241368 RepID=A0A2Z6B0J9_9BACT|nr:deoxyhypusine synthase family protein [Desulfovibrio ferrophilus]BBD09022.1 deoxyhypusine synthase-like protein [Desulfovibrio ferrophilus]
MTAIRAFMEEHFKHFNARETLDAAKGWCDLLDGGGQMFLAMAGAMSTAEIGISLARMIRQGKVHAISCTAANLEEDIFNLFAGNEYKILPEYRDLTPQDEVALRDSGLNRVTDTCIPETVMKEIEDHIVQMWTEAASRGEAKFPHQFLNDVLDIPGIEDRFQLPRERSWVLAAKEMSIPIYTPGWEDSTLGNIYTAEVMLGNIPNHNGVKRGTQQLEHLAGWYKKRADAEIPVGFFQIGGGISGDFSICVVPMLIQDCYLEDTPYWAYFAQIGDSTTSYGSYSGAPPNEKITWHKLAPDTPRFMINSDASIVAPLIFTYVLEDSSS